MTKQKEAIKKEMVEQFLWWAKFNPTLVQNYFGCDLQTLKYILKHDIFQK